MLSAWAINRHVRAGSSNVSCTKAATIASLGETTSTLNSLGVMAISHNFSKLTNQSNTYKSIYPRVKSITVKVKSSEFLGSGIILTQKGCEYTVLTNAHVVEAGREPYHVQTSDRKIWKAKLIKNQYEGNSDLAILRFRTDGISYSVATIGSTPSEGDLVFAGGFPATEDAIRAKKFNLTTGNVSIVLSKALQGGYRIGYTNDIQKGMSGGPLVNTRGEVVGVNGMQAYPLWEIPSVYADGNKVEPLLHKRINSLSWAVPMILF